MRNKITMAALAGVIAAGITVPLAASMASATTTAPAVRPASASVHVTVPARSEDDASRQVAIYGGAAHVTVKGVDVKISPAGPGSYGDYSRGAWRLVLKVPAAH